MMTGNFQEAATNTVGDWFALLLAGLGITFAPYEYVGGIFFALSCAMITRHWFPEKDRREVWVTLVAAFIVATLGAELWAWRFPEAGVPLQMVMALLGFGSRVVVTISMKLLLRLETRSDEIADKLIDRAVPDDERE